MVLDDVQFARRDYQHAARLAALDDPKQQQWLSVETHLPYGRATLIRDAQLTDPQRAARRLGQLPAQHYHASPPLAVAAGCARTRRPHRRRGRRYSGRR
ncbi:WbqC family protein [Streptomyces sp. NPDC058394]|uniref:WbqC family protein n=1 Tax=unclassified Streptomyces TaxID=2593676 RepID=UPI003669F63A